MSGIHYLGIDMGTSGCRACLIDAEANEIASSETHVPAPQNKSGRISQNPNIWRKAMDDTLRALANMTDLSTVRAISIDGTSGTVLVVDDQGEPLAEALLYNDQSCEAEAQAIADVAPATSPARGASSGLAKALSLHRAFPHGKILHQADWLLGILAGEFTFSDENNSLKTGYDSLNERWPIWINKLENISNKLPHVKKAGQTVAPVNRQMQNRFGFSAQCLMIAGTTDSSAAFLAAGASNIGDAVTSLGSTLAIKIISPKPIFAPEFGIYSHHLLGNWLAGGASNTGGQVLLNWFSVDEMQSLATQLQPSTKTGLDYYPLIRPGERFPINDPHYNPRLEPIPEDRSVFFQGLLEGIAKIEKYCYEKLHELGAPYPTRIFTAGGGAKNNAWMQIRQQTLGIPVQLASHTEAAYGAALLARSSFN